MQNIPVKTEMGRDIRKVFVADDNCKLVDADYSQVELRVLAHMSGDENMIDAFKHGEDIHSKTASQIFDVDIKDVTSKQRIEAKAINFGIIYGKTDFGLSQDLNIPVATAKAYIDSYFNKYPKIKAGQFLIEISEYFNNFLLVEQQHHNKEDRQQVHLDANLLKLAGDQVNQHITQKSKDDAVCNAVRKRNRDDADKGRNSFRIIIQVNFLNAGDH